MAENTNHFTQIIPRRLVIDNSVLISWALEEDEAGHIDTIKQIVSDDEVQLLAPFLLKYELLNVFRSVIAQGRARLDQILPKVEELAAFEISYITEVPFVDIFQLAVKKDISAYDASYVWLAKEYQIPLFTLDLKLQKKVQGYVEILDLGAM